MIKCSNCKWLAAVGCNNKMKSYCTKLENIIRHPTMCGCSFAEEEKEDGNSES